MKFVQKLLILALSIPYQLVGTTTPVQTATTSTAASAVALTGDSEMPHGEKRKDDDQQTGR